MNFDLLISIGFIFLTRERKQSYIKLTNICIMNIQFYLDNKNKNEQKVNEEL